jgi:hypothetical protein
MERNMSNNRTYEEDFKIIDTTDIQIQSLVKYGAAVGYEAVYRTDENGKDILVRFKQPNFRCVGQEYTSVRTMLKLHNEASEQTFEYVKTLSKDESLAEFLNRENDEGYNLINLLFAGTCKTVQQVKGQYTRKKGLVIQSGMVKFMTDHAYYQHACMLLDEDKQ